MTRVRVEQRQEPVGRVVDREREPVGFDVAEPSARRELGRGVVVGAIGSEPSQAGELGRELLVRSPDRGPSGRVGVGDVCVPPQGDDSLRLATPGPPSRNRRVGRPSARRSPTRRRRTAGRRPRPTRTSPSARRRRRTPPADHGRPSRASRRARSPRPASPLAPIRGCLPRPYPDFYHGRDAPASDRSRGSHRRPHPDSRAEPRHRCRRHRRERETDSNSRQR